MSKIKNLYYYQMKETSKKNDSSCDTETGQCAPSTNLSKKETFNEPNQASLPYKLIYYYDALCGWCYGFSPVIAKLYDRYKKTMAIELISGGLFLGERVGLVNTVAPYIKAGAYKSVEATTGVTFGTGFLSDLNGSGSMVLNSLPPAIALSIVKATCPEVQLEFGALLLHAIYNEGMHSDSIDGLANCASKIGLDPDVFKMQMRDAHYKIKAEQDFEIFKRSPHTGMPTLVLECDGAQIVLSRGYASFNDLSSKLDAIIASKSV